MRNGQVISMDKVCQRGAKSSVLESFSIPTALTRDHTDEQ
jgi:hypothetical protein